jgi:hypothetical protein
MIRMAQAALVCAMLVATGLVGAARAADFRVENSVYAGTEKEPAARSTTIFSQGVVYDFLESPAEVTIFDPAQRRFILLDVDRKMKTELPTRVVGETIDRLARRAAESKDRQIQFLSKPVFAESVDEKTSERVFDSDWLTYRVQAQRTADAEVALQYREFSDWYARLNTFLRPGSPLPLARHAINEALARRQEIPSRLALVVKHPGGLSLKRDQIRSEHQFVRRLVESDLRRVAAAGEQMAAFRAVNFREYERRPEKK